MKRKAFVLLFFIILIVAVIYRINPKSGSIDKLVFANYSNTSFVDIDIYKKNVHKVCGDSNQINEFLSYLKKVQLTEFNGKVPYDSSNVYFIGVYSNSNSYLGIIIENKDFIEVTMKADDGKVIAKKYKVTNNSLDMKYIDNLYEKGKTIGQ